jgi:uncharacterized protein (UPF0335 family)
MAESEKSTLKISAAIRRVYSDLKNDGEKQILIQQIVNTIIEDEPALVEKEKVRLFRDAIGNRIRKILK